MATSGARSLDDGEQRSDPSSAPSPTAGPAPRPAIARAGVFALVVLALAALGYLYLLPASRDLLAGRTDVILSNGGDHTSVPGIYWALSRVARHHPERMLYGAPYTEMLDAPNGLALWSPWIERLIVGVLGPVVPPETMITAVVWLLMILDGVCFYVFGRVEGWRRPVAFALSVAFAFCVYTRARGAVHAALVGVYALPAIFAALRLTQRARGWRDLVAPAGLFLLAATSPHYYVIMVLGISPVLLWFYLRDLRPAPGGPGAPLAWVGRPLVHVGVAAAPALALLAWSVLAPVPPSLRGKDMVHRPPIMTHWLTEFAARPTDYAVGDISLVTPETPLRDLNPLRARVSRYARDTVHPSNFHERSNGIRWLVLAPFLALMVIFVPRGWRARLDPVVRRRALGYLIFALAAFALSLAPSALHLEVDLGPSLLLHKLVPNFRVPGRFGVFVHFGVLAVVGWALHRLLERRRVWERPRLGLAVGALLPLLVIADYPPLMPMPMAAVAPTLEPLEAAAVDGRCGAGMIFPYLAAHPDFIDEHEFYESLQRLRRTGCELVNRTSVTGLSMRMLGLFGREAYDPLDAAKEDRFVRFVQCTRLSWLLFRPGLGDSPRARLCAKLHFQRVGADACRSPRPAVPLVPLEQCLASVYGSDRER